MYNHDRQFWVFLDGFFPVVFVYSWRYQARLSHVQLGMESSKTSDINTEYQKYLQVFVSVIPFNSVSCIFQFHIWKCVIQHHSKSHFQLVHFCTVAHFGNLTFFKYFYKQFNLATKGDWRKLAIWYISIACYWQLTSTSRIELDCWEQLAS